MGVLGEQDEYVVQCWLSALLTKSLLHPIDTLKIRVQVSPKEPFRAFLSRWSGQWGVIALFRGLGTKLLLYAPYQLTYLACFVSVNNTLNASAGVFPGSISDTQRIVCTTFLATALAEIASSPIRVFMELNKSRVQVGKAGILRASLLSSSTSPLSMCTSWQAVQAKGSELYKHARANRVYLRKCFQTYFTAQIVLHDLPFSCIQWSTYKIAKLYQKEDNSEISQNHFWQSIQTGILCGFLTTLATQPSDVIRCCVLTQDPFHVHNKSHGRPIRHTFRTIWLEGGVRRLYKGLGVRFVWIASNSVLFFSALDYMKRVGFGK